MAKATPTRTQKEDDKAPQQPGTALAEHKGYAVGEVIDYGADAGAGMEGATSESFAIPFLAALQKGSPQVDEASGVAIEGAKSGMLFETVSQKMFDGKRGVLFVPCAFKRVFVHWGPREGEGKGFKGEVLPEAVAQLRAEGKVIEVDRKLLFPKPDGTLHDKKCDRLSDTRNHYGLLIDEETGIYTPVLMSLTSTQIKKSKMLMSLLAGIKLRGPAGLYTPPTYANIIRVTTIPEQNDQGTWYGVKFEHEGAVSSREIYAAAKAFHASVVKGAVQAADYGAVTPDAESRDDDGKM